MYEGQKLHPWHQKHSFMPTVFVKSNYIVLCLFLERDRHVKLLTVMILSSGDL